MHYTVWTCGYTRERTPAHRRGLLARSWTFLTPAILLILAAPAWAQQSERDGERGRALFDEKCIVCHTIGDGDHLGPDLAGVVDRRSRDWLVRFIVEPDRVLASGDAAAVELLKKYNELPMPNLGLTSEDAEEIVEYLAGPRAAAGTGATAAGPGVQATPKMLGPQSAILYTFVAVTLLIVIVFGIVVASTRTASTVDVARAFQLRRVLFMIGLILVASVAIVTLPRAPYAKEGISADRIVYVAARQYDFVFSEEPIVTAEDISRVRRIQSLEFAAGELVEFRVTSLDVTHGFGIYGPERQLLVQTQAMPGYVNRLLVRLDRSGPHLALCMEYCAGGHHLMQASFTVNDAKPVASHRTQAALITR